MAPRGAVSVRKACVILYVRVNTVCTCHRLSFTIVNECPRLKPHEDPNISKWFVKYKKIAG